MKLKVLELFAGIGACSKALERLGVDHEIVDAVEIDKYAIKSFNAIHGTNFETQDITKWDKDVEVDLIMHGSPCQDFSVAGKQAGGNEGSGTRSSLMYETVRIVKKLKPKYVVWENVRNILSKNHVHNFNNYISTMELLGYKNYYQVLNAKDYGIPQNRERVFTISILGDDNFIFPEKQELKLRLKDMLEYEVDEKYYISETVANKIQSDLINKNTLMIDLCQWRREGHPREYNDISPTLSSRDYKEPRCIQVGNLSGGKWDKINESCRRVYDEEGISPTIHTCQGENTETKVITSAAMRGRYNENGEVEQHIEISDRQEANSITTVQKDSMVCNGMRIRKLTPKECWRLMGFNDYDFEKVERINSNSQLYKQAGNSIVVNVLESIFKNLLNLS